MTILALLMTLSGEPTAGATPEHDVALRIESQALLDHQAADAADDTTYFVRTDSTKALSEQDGVRVVDDDTVPAIVVSLSWVSYADSIYGVRVETVRPGKAPRLVESFECECADSELTAAVIARLPKALEQLEEREPPVAEPVVEPVATDPAADRLAEQPDGAPRKPLGTLGKAGIGVAVVGASTLVGGGIVYALGTRFDPPSGRLEERDGRNFGPPGIALLVSGGAALVTGVALLIVDRARPRKAASALLLPSPGGLVLTGRF